MTLVFLLCVITAEGRSKKTTAMMGMDITSIVRHRTGGVLVSHAFEEHWTAGGKMTFNVIPEIKKDQERTDHENEFGNNETEDGDTRPASASVELSYWPGRAYKGFFVSVGCRYERNGKPECTIGAGYSVCIMDNLAVQLSFLSGIGRREEHLQDAIGIGLCYLF